MKIYTKTGDKGETGLFGGKRVSKDTLRIEAYGSVDELNCLLGLIQSLGPEKAIASMVNKIQNQLFELGADLATPLTNKNPVIPRMKLQHATSLEKMIDRLDRSLQPLQSFILPGGNAVASHLHLARTVCRRAERSVVRLSRNEEIGTAVIVYLNRLSDLLFVMARYANHRGGHEEVQWVSGRRKTK